MLGLHAVAIPGVGISLGHFGHAFIEGGNAVAVRIERFTLRLTQCAFHQRVKPDRHAEACLRFHLGPDFLLRLQMHIGRCALRALGRLEALNGRLQGAEFCFTTGNQRHLYFTAVDPAAGIGKQALLQDADFRQHRGRLGGAKGLANRLGRVLVAPHTLGHADALDSLQQLGSAAVVTGGAGRPDHQFDSFISL